MLLRRGLLDEIEWHALVRSAALDALLALASQMIRARAAAGTSFVPYRAPANGSILGMDIGRAWDHAWHEAVRLAGYDVAPDARLRLRGGPGWPSAARRPRCWSRWTAAPPSAS
jgi:hypothetical protein